ncbi:MAG: BamA/TamA family outer membrane protein, partial [Rhodothermales bacterium]
AEGAERARDGYLARLTGLRPGQQLKTFDPEELRRRLEQTGHFRDVSLPRLVVSGDSAAIRFVVREEAPGSFDLAFGYLPGGSAGSLAGSGHLDLRNPLGYGRRFSANLERLPGQTSRVELSASDPYVLGTSMHGAVSFAGYQQDSLFHRQRFGIEMGFDLGGGLLAVGAATREATRPGVAGLQIDGSRQRIARTHGSMLGLGFRYSRIDNAVSPSRGLVVDLFAERGIRSQRLTRVVNGTPVREDRAIRQDRLEFLLRSYSRLSRRGVAVVGLDLRALISDEYDRSDLYRVGGLRTLRGYDDDLFLARAVGRTLLEYRHRLERRSYLFGFVDGAYLDRPPSVSLDGFSAARLGYGVGMQFDTGISLMNIVLATNPIDGFGSTRVHAGLSFGL